MRQEIETAPRDGKDIFVEDARGAFDVAHWSSEVGEWVWKNGNPIRIKPTHWYPIRQLEHSLEDEQSSGPSHVGSARRRFTTSSIAVTLVAAALIGVYFRFEVADAARQTLTASTVQHRQPLDEERARGDALAGELAASRRDLDTKVALLSKANDEAAQLRQRADELGQSLQKERDRCAALATELAKARRDMEQKTAAVKERSGVFLPAWVNSDALVKPADTAKQPNVAAETSRPAIKPAETVPLPKPRGRAVSQGDSYGCQYYRTYDSETGTYKGYDGRRLSCRPPGSGREPGIALQRRQGPSAEVNPDITGSTNVAQPEDPAASGSHGQVDVEAKAAETPKPTGLIGWFGR
ncbi:MAG: hypothetical protein ACJ8EL_18985 [Rhizomicrobium sp.]